MGQNVGQLWIELGADVARLRKDMGEATTVIKSFKSEAESAFKGIQAAALSYLSFQGITQLFKATVQAAAEEEQSLLRLEATLSAHGVTNKEVIRIYNDMANSMQMTTRYTDDQVRSATGLLLQYNVMPSKIQDVIKSATNLATRTGDLESATQALAMAYNGNYKSLRQYYPDIKKATDAGASFNDILKELNNRFGDIAQKEMEGYSGQVNRLKKEWSEFGESIGSMVVPALTALLAQLNAIGKAEINDELLMAGMGSPAMAADIANKPAATKTDTFDWDTWYKMEKDRNTLLAAEQVFAHNIASDTEKANKNIKDTAMSFEELRDLWIKAEAEKYAATEDFNEKYLADEKKRQEDFDAIVDKQNKDLAEQQVIALREYYEEKSRHILAIGLLEREQIELQREAIDQLFSEIMSMASSAGVYGEGAGKMAQGMYQWTNAFTGNDEYKDRLAAAQEYYDALYALAEKSEAQIAQMNQAYDRMIEINKEASFQRTARMYSSAFGVMAGAALQYYNSTGQQSKAAFAVYKALAVAETTIATIAAAQKAYDKGMEVTNSMGGGVAFAAIATIAGMARVAQIMSTNPGSSSSISSYGGGVGYAAESPVVAEDTQDKTIQNRNVNVYVYGNVVDHQKFARDLVQYLDEAESDGVH